MPIDPSDRLPTQPGQEPDFDGIDVDILDDGTVKLHTKCKPGQDPRECARKVRFLVEALGLPIDRIVTDIEDADGTHVTLPDAASPPDAS